MSTNFSGSGLWVPGTDIFVNGGFLVNQRGQTSYRVPGNTYTVDRWKSNLDAQIDVVADGIKIHSLGIAYSGVWQQTENLYLRTGDTFTFSADFPTAPPPGWYIDAQVVRVSDGVGVCGNNTIGHDLHQGINYITFSMPNETNGLHFIRCFICNCLSEDTVAHVHRAKLEPGSVSTLMYDAPPDMAVELARCQRYYHKSTQSPWGERWRQPSEDTSVAAPVRLLCEMRTVPSIILYGEGGETGVIWEWGADGILAHAENVTKTGFCVSAESKLGAGKWYFVRWIADAEIH